MEDSLNPEYQMKILFRNKKENLHLHRSFSLDVRTEFSRDIGRTWLSKNGLTRNYDVSKKWSPWITWKKK